MLRNLKLGAKQTLGFGLILAIMAAANLYSLSRLANLNKDFSVVSTNWLPRVVAISDIYLSTSELRTTQVHYATAEDKKSRLIQAEKIIELLDRIDDNLDTYGSLRQASEQKGLYTEEERRLYEDGFDPNWEEYLNLSMTALDLSREDPAAAVDLLMQEERGAFDAVTFDLEQLVSVNRQNSLAAGVNAERTYNETRNFTITLLIVTVVLSIVLAGGLVRLITVPVQHLERAAQTVAQGDLSVRLEDTGRDEIGSLARSFNQMTVSLREA